MTKVPDIRKRPVNNQPLNPNGQYVLYWMTAYRRTGWNFALQHAVKHADELGKPLVIFEALRCDYPYASARLHRFVLDGMRANMAALEKSPATYYPYVESREGAGKGLLAALSAESCLVVTDDFPAFFHPRMLAAAGNHLPLRLEAVDSNGLLPLRMSDHAYPTAYAFRRFLQKSLPEHLLAHPEKDPLSMLTTSARAEIPDSILTRWPAAAPELLKGTGSCFDALPIDHRIVPTALAGGQGVARNRLRVFLDERLDRYDKERNHPDASIPSGLSPYLHFGHISSHEIFAAIAEYEDWAPHDLSAKTDGKRSGWWGMSVNAEAFLDQLITWRELGFNMCQHEPKRYNLYDSLPEWARHTLDEHSGDPRPYCYTYEELRDAQTHDEIWNAAQRQLLRDGMIHNYLRMLWGKKILEWSPTPQQALEIMLDLNDRYALDGRDPNSVSGIFWCLGRYDRPWGPTRPIFGSIRYMSSENTKRKIHLKKYLEEFS